MKIACVRENNWHKENFMAIESVDKLTHDLERLLDKALPGLPAEIRDRELKHHLMNTLPEKVSLQLKLLPTHTYTIYQRVDKEDGHIQQINPKEERLDRLETAVQQVLNN